MKKLFFILTIVSGTGLLSCTSESGGMSATAKKNKEVNDAIMKAYEAGDYSKIGDYITADAADHGGWTGEVQGLDNIVEDMKKFHEQMQVMKSERIRTMADDEYVMVWSKLSANAKTDMLGIKAGQPFSMTRLDVSKFKDGKAVEHWIYVDPKDVMQFMSPAGTNPVREN